MNIYQEEAFILMKRNRLIAIFLLFMFLPSVEMGIFAAPISFNMDPGLGSIMELTTIGTIGITFLLLFFPMIAIIIFFIRLRSCIKKRDNMKKFRFDCISALFGISVGIAIFYLLPINLIVQFSALITTFLIDCFDWMQIVC